ncbi:MAG: response regulator [Thermoanaerobaculia bacterium]|nr:response regulator [Thermoanaerobaculia bacterium]
MHLELSFSSGSRLLHGLLIFLLLTVQGIPHAQNIPYENVTIADGLSQGMIFHAIQASDGFLWFGTKDGLNRYDGYNFKVYTNDPFDPFSISGNVVRYIYEDSRENLWIVIENSDLNLFDKKTGKFYRLPVGPGGLPAVPQSFVTEMPDGSFWVGTAHGLCHLYWKPGRAGPAPGNADLRAALQVETVYPDKEQGLTSENPDNFNSGALGPDGTLWVVSNHCPYRLVKGSDRFQPVPLPVKATLKPYFLELYANKDGSILVVFALGNTMIFQSASYIDGIWSFHPELKQYKMSGLSSPYQDQSALQRAIRDKDVFQTQKLLDCGTPGHSHGKPLFDRSGNIWVGTNGYGLHKFKPASSLFRHYFKGQSISRIFANSSGEAFISRDFYKMATGRHGTSGWEFNLSPDQTAYPPGVYLETQTGIGWHVNNVGLLVRTDPDGSKRAYNFGLSTPQLLATDHSGMLWASKDGSKLLCFDPSADRPLTYDLSGLLGPVSSFYALLPDKKGHVWITNSQGLVEGIPDGKGGYTFKVWRNDPANPHSLGYNATLSLCEDPVLPDKYLWVGTKGGGLNRLNKASGQFFQLNTRNSDLPNDVAYGILPDEAGNLWVSTNRGLSRVTLPREDAGPPDPRNFYFQNYRAADGLQDDEFNTGAYFRCPDGQLMFGGVNGLTAFYPKQLPKRNNDAPVHITDLKINNQPRNEQYPAGTLKLPYDQNTLTIEFALLDFANPKENRYRYRLKGADPDWVDAGTRHFANYTRLGPGAYRFEVEGSTGGGIWSPHAATLDFVIYPPWWASWWAYTMYAILLLGGAYYFYSFQLKRKLEHAENERLKDLDAVKTRLYTNITHEFRTPLTVILGLAAEISREGNSRIQEMARVVQRNGQGLLRLINQMLDLAKLDSGAMQLQPVRTDVVAFCRYVSESFHSLAASRQIQLHFLTELPVFEMDFDKEKLQNILHNLLGNAIKFTPEGGHVYLQIAHWNRWQPPAPRGWHQTVTPVKNMERAWILLRVSDTGPGIPESDWPTIFDRFAQSKTSAVVGGTGIGLALVRELVQLMQGGLALRNVPGKGAEFMVALPVFQDAEPADHLPADSPPFQPDIQERVLPAAGAVSADAGDMPVLLLVEDNADVAEYIQNCLAEGYRVAYARDGQAGIDMALEQIPDLIVSDVMMPVKDGFDLTDTLKNDERTSHIPIVLLTAKSSVDDRIAGLKRGADAYLIKPFHREELLATLRQLLENRRRVQAFFSRRIFLDPAEPLPPEADLEDAFLQKLRGVVEANLSDPDFEMPQLERALAMSRSQIFRKVKALTGKSPSLFIRSIRLAKARELLRSTTLTVSEVAYDTGFSSLQYFSDAFFEEFGERPSATRN